MKAITYSIAMAGILASLASCKDDNMAMPSDMPYTFKVENVQQVQPFVQTGTFKGEGTPPVIKPGQSVSFTFSAGKGQALSFATMYGWSNDLFFAPANPGIALYDQSGNPMEGDVSSQIRLWDNGSKINQMPGAANPHNSADQNGVVTEVNGADAQGFTYLPASKLLNASLKYNQNATFTLTLKNISGGTANETPVSPGVWVISNYLGGNLLNKAPLYASGQPTANGLQPLSEKGDNSVLATYLNAHTQVATGLSPVVVIVYNGNTRPIFTQGAADPGNGLADIAQEGNQTALVASLQKAAGVKHVYVLSPSDKPVTPGSSAQAQIEAAPGDKLAFVTMFGSSNNWFYAFDDMGILVNASGDLTGNVKLWNDGTEVDEYPGAGNHQPQFNPGSKNPASKPVMEVDKSLYPSLPAIKDVIKVTFTK
ncbi:MAG TPA: spondin domain-containing protein [Chitinophaga sp.]|uniref:spondin domain-containing protein n=1 Tax=Chitinophaga sp. TaxID=1869181 RepID=UPI002CDE18AD|nr:spondin domain-containing protein [Chitinophaga sp.]HVI45166.1 spondin domain-containing protein [Chitinophaga sp.]